MKKYLLLLILCSLFNTASAMIVDAPLEKFYSIEAEDGEVVQLPKSLIGQCKTLKNMIGDLEGAEGGVIPVQTSAESLQLLIALHTSPDEDKRKELLEDESIVGMIDLFKLIDFFDYNLSKKTINDIIIHEVTGSQEIIESILTGKKLSLGQGSGK